MQSPESTAHAGVQSPNVPDGCIRLSTNMRMDLHLRLKMRATRERTSIRELLEAWVTSWPENIDS